MLGTIAKSIFLFLLISFSLLFILFSPNHLQTVYYKGSIRIDRDNFSIPTLHVSTIEQYLYALGTVEAEDRLFQITFRSYAAQGRLSEFLGEKTLQFDRYMREINFKKWGDLRTQRFRKQNETQFAIFQAMILGINQRVAKMSVLPMQFYLTGMKWQNFTMNHLFYLAVQFQWGVSMNIVDEYTRSVLLTNYTKEQIDWILPNKKEYWAFQSIPIVNDEEIPSEVRTQNVKDRLEKINFNPLSVDRLIQLQIIEFFGTNFDASNCWAVSGQYTQTGLPLLSSDPHLQNIAPSQWYQFIVNYTDSNGKKAYSAGGTNPGSPHAYGKTSNFATGYSISHGDNQDLFRQTIKDNKYLVDGKWRDLILRNETILIKSWGGLKQQHYQVRQTHRGPIIHYIFNPLGSFNLQNDTLSLAWTGFNNQWESFIKLTYIFLIDNLEDLQDALRYKTKTFLNVNVISITADNHIIMQQSGLHPIRRNAQSGTYIKDGTTTQHDWIGIVPPEHRMHIMDPPKGYIINANNRVAENQYYGGYLDYTVYTARADRLEEIVRGEIESGRKIGVDFVKKTLMDTVDVYCRQILPEIVEVVSQAKIMSSFDCNFSAESHLATVYQVFFYELYHLIKPFTPQKMSLITFHQMQQGLYNYIHFAFRGNTTNRKILCTAWNKTILHLQNYFQTKDMSKWQWGQLHIDTNQHVPFRNHPLLSRIFNLQFGGCGNAHTPNVGKMQQLQFGSFRTSHRANSRAIYGFGGDHLNWFIIDTGASQNILSKHYSDQHKLIQRGDMIEIAISNTNGKDGNEEEL